MSETKQELSKNIVRYIARFERLRKRFLNERFKPYKLQGPMYLIILYLFRHIGTNQDALVEFLGIDKSDIARKCRKLETLGYIYRKQSQTNRRENELYLTDTGKELMPVIQGALDEWHDWATVGINPIDQQKMSDHLELMLNNVISKNI